MVSDVFFFNELSASFSDPLSSIRKSHEEVMGEVMSCTQSKSEHSFLLL